jgi:hypothetical protein
MKFFKKLKVKKFVKQISPDIKVKFGRALECEPTENTIYVAFKSNEVDKKTFMEYVKELDKNCNFNDIVLGILHEIGHIFTYDENDEEPYLQDTELLSKLYKENMLTDRQVNEFYLRLDMESKATKWAIEFAQANQMFVKKFQEKIS